MVTARDAKAWEWVPPHCGKDKLALEKLKCTNSTENSDVMLILAIRSTASCLLSLPRSCPGASTGEIKNSIAEFGLTKCAAYRIFQGVYFSYTRHNGRMHDSQCNMPTEAVPRKR
ncbi:hypothetical protein [Nitrosomonas sp. Is37]|uniref:hypothetical protein n=1 Tax=Nitrosomonas sp. Is37 TaxID=3080535 RepID=UPI00294B347A|nr:hypothetical protein [Nitrosomonas sp. Is37]MDV6344910.1 hypothetical protein [Nitrosomonas sp. Is37]